MTPTPDKPNPPRDRIAEDFDRAFALIQGQILTSRGKNVGECTTNHIVPTVLTREG